MSAPAPSRPPDRPPGRPGGWPLPMSGGFSWPAAATTLGLQLLPRAAAAAAGLAAPPPEAPPPCVLGWEEAGGAGGGWGGGWRGGFWGPRGWPPRRAPEPWGRPAGWWPAGGAGGGEGSAGPAFASAWPPRNRRAVPWAGGGGGRADSGNGRIAFGGPFAADRRGPGGPGGNNGWRSGRRSSGRPFMRGGSAPAANSRPRDRTFQHRTARPQQALRPTPSAAAVPPPPAASLISMAHAAGIPYLAQWFAPRSDGRCPGETVTAADLEQFTADLAGAEVDKSSKLLLQLAVFLALLSSPRPQRQKEIAAFAADRWCPLGHFVSFTYNPKHVAKAWKAADGVLRGGSDDRGEGNYNGAAAWDQESNESSEINVSNAGGVSGSRSERSAAPGAGGSPVHAAAAADYLRGSLYPPFRSLSAGLTLMKLPSRRVAREKALNVELRLTWEAVRELTDSVAEGWEEFIADSPDSGPAREASLVKATVAGESLGALLPTVAHLAKAAVTGAWFDPATCRFQEWSPASLRVLCTAIQPSSLGHGRFLREAIYPLLRGHAEGGEQDSKTMDTGRWEDCVEAMYRLVHQQERQQQPPAPETPGSASRSLQQPLFVPRAFHRKKFFSKVIKPFEQLLRERPLTALPHMAVVIPRSTLDAWAAAAAGIRVIAFGAVDVAGVKGTVCSAIQRPLQVVSPDASLRRLFLATASRDALMSFTCHICERNKQFIAVEGAPAPPTALPPTALPPPALPPTALPPTALPPTALPPPALPPTALPPPALPPPALPPTALPPTALPPTASEEYSSFSSSKAEEAENA